MKVTYDLTDTMSFCLLLPGILGLLSVYYWLNQIALTFISPAISTFKLVLGLQASFLPQSIHVFKDFFDSVAEELGMVHGAFRVSDCGDHDRKLHQSFKDGSE